MPSVTRGTRFIQTFDQSRAFSGSRLQPSRLSLSFFMSSTADCRMAFGVDTKRKMTTISA